MEAIKNMTIEEARAAGLDISHRGSIAPEGYRWVYGELEKKPPPAEAAEWETLTDTPRKCRTIDKAAFTFKPEAKSWFPVDPDRITLEGKTHKKASEAVTALIEWCKRYKQQGGYRDGRGEFILYADLYDYCDILPL